MSTMTNPCEEFEIAALRRARGNLEPDAAARLDEHLRGCANCRRFAETVDATEKALHGWVRTLSADHDWDRIRAGFRRRRLANRNRIISGLATCLVLAALAWWAQGPAIGAMILGVTIIGFAVTYFTFVAPRRRRACAAESADTELLAHYRNELDEEIRALRRSRPFRNVSLIVSVVLLVLVGGSVAEEVGPNGSLRVARSVTLIFIATLSVVRWFRERRLLPRLERERRELG